MDLAGQNSNDRFGERLKRLCQLRRHLKKHAPRHWEKLVRSYVGNLCWLYVLRFVCRMLRKKIVVISLIGRMGDVVACEPVARQIRQEYPGEVILWCVSPRYRSLISSNPLVTRPLTVVCLTEWVWLQRHRLFDRVVDLHVNRKECGSCVLPQTKPTGRVEITTENYYHFGPLLTAFTESAGYPVASQQPQVYLSPHIREIVDRLWLPPHFVAIHALSDEESRNWVREKWWSLVGLIDAKLGLPVVEVGHQSALESRPAGRFTSLCGRCRILETAEVIRRAELFIGVDSGPAHLANAVRTPGVILLGRYRVFDDYVPYTGFYADARNATLIRHRGPAQGITVATGFAAVEEGLARRRTSSLSSTADAHVRNAPSQDRNRARKSGL